MCLPLIQDLPSQVTSDQIDSAYWLSLMTSDAIELCISTVAFIFVFYVFVRNCIIY